MKLSPKRAEALSLTAFVLQGLFFFLMLFVSAQGNSNSLAVRVEAWHFLGGAGIWLVLLLQFRQRRMAQEERLDAEQYQRLRREGRETSVFESSAVEDGFNLASRRLAWMEKYLLPVSAILIAVYHLALGYWLFKAVRSPEIQELGGHDIVFKSAVFIAGFALVSFLFSRYAVGMSRQAEWRPLRAGGSYLFSNALASFGLAVVLLVANAGYPIVERIAAYVLVILMLTTGVEMVLNLVLDAYRPRIKGRYHRAAFESRLLGLFSEPGGLLRTAAQAIDYQFGFNVSETWFFKLLSQAFVWLILAMGTTLYLLSSLSIIPTGSVGVLERFGRPANIERPWTAGLHLKCPWPIDKVRTFPVEQIHVIDVGFERKDPKIDERTGRAIPDLTPILWTKEHWKAESPFMVALSETTAVFSKPAAGVSTAVASGSSFDESVMRNDFDMLVVAFVIHYRIDDVAEYGYGRDKCYVDPGKLLKSICNRQAVHFCARSDIESLLGPGRHQTAQTLKQTIQARVDEYQMGVKITFVGMESAHPPIKVAEAFEKVISALQQKQALVLLARGQANAVLSRAVGESNVIQAQARAYGFDRPLLAKADSDRFAHQIEAFQKGGNVYLWREYLSVLDEMLPALRKYIITSDNISRWVYELDLKEKLQPDLFSGLGIPEEQQESIK